MKTAKAISLFMASRESKGLSRQTIRWYYGILQCFASHYSKLPRHPEQIELFLGNLSVGDERRHGYYQALRVFYRFLQRRWGIKNPTEIVEPPKRKPKYPAVLSPEDLNRLLNYPHPPKIKAGILFLIDTGARCGELANLQCPDLDETPFGFTAVIQGKTGMRTVPISYGTYHALMVNLPFPYLPHRLGELISRAFKNAGIAGNALTLRHTFATLWEGDELVLQSIMGHSNLETTKRYRHLRMRRLSEQHEQYSPLKMVLSSSKSML